MSAVLPTRGTDSLKSGQGHRFAFRAFARVADRKQIRLLFLISVEAGAWSLDASFGSENSGRNSGA
jgi:hypothetical protein